MNKINKIISCLAVGSMLFSFAGCNVVEKTPEAMQKEVVAKVGKEKITKEELDKNPKLKSVKNAMEQKYGKEYYKNDEAKSQLNGIRLKLLDEVTMERLLLQKAHEQGLDKDEKAIDKEVKKQFDGIKDIYAKGKSDKEFKKDLKQAGFSEAEYKEYLKNGIVISKLYEKTTKDVKASDKEIKEYYDSHLQEFTEKPNRIHVSHILVDSEEKAKKAKERLDKGEDFSKVAKEVSKDKVANEKGGDLGYINANDPNYDPMFMAAARALSKGQTSGPIQSSFGWHIIKMIEKEEYPPQKLEVVKDKAKEQVLKNKKGSKWQKSLETWKKEAKIKIYNKNLQ